MASGLTVAGCRSRERWLGDGAFVVGVFAAHGFRATQLATILIDIDAARADQVRVQGLLALAVHHDHFVLAQSDFGGQRATLATCRSGKLRMKT